ncbi:MAG: hypothetical protein J6B12_04000 [Clostridia bacterium]|nr:hypothetical protein [Clostridia bacterium]
MHEGHRARMREKFLKGGDKALLDHELLEMLLFYAIPICNTNEIAHTLLKTFGSLRGVAEADFYALQTVPGIGENAATLLNLLGTFSRRYLQEPAVHIMKFNKIAVAREFGIFMLRGCANEQLHALLLDNQLRKIDFFMLEEGTANSVSINLQSLYGHCIARHVSAVILYHNHPNGICVPSREDLNLTYTIEGKLADIGIYLLEHFVVSDHSCMSILNVQGSSLRPIKTREKVERQTLEDFYCE